MNDTRKSVVIAMVMGLATFVLAFATRTRDFGGDDTVFAMTVEDWLRGRAQTADLFGVHHFLHNPLVAFVSSVVRDVWPHALVLDVGAGVSAAFAGLAVALVVLVLLKAGTDASIAVLAGAVVAVCGGIWNIATHNEVYTMAAAAVALWLYVASDPRCRAWAVGMTVALGVLCHAVLGLLILPSLWIFRKRPRAIATLIAVGTGVPAIVFVSVFVLARGMTSPLAWLGEIVPAETLGFVAPALSVHDALRGLVVWQWYHSVPVMIPSVMRVIDALAWVTVLVAAVLAAWGVVAALKAGNRTARTALAGLVAFVPLWFLWDVGNPEHAVAAAPLFAVVIAFGVGRWPVRMGRLALGSLVALLLVVNGLGSAAFQSRPENGRVWVTAGFLTETAGADAVVLSLGTDGRLRLGLGYLSGRNLVDLTLTTRSARLAGRPTEDGLAYWLHRAGEAGELWVLDEVLAPESAAWVEQIGIQPESWQGAVARLEVLETRELPADGVVIVEPFRIHRVRLGGDPVSATR